MNEVKQIRIKIVNGIDTDGKISYSKNFDLMNINDYKLLKVTCINKMIRGFSIEINSFNEESINNENEFQTIIEYLVAEDKCHHFLFMNHPFQKMPYHIITESILDVNEDILLLLNTIVPGDINEIMCTITNMFELEKVEEKQKITKLFKKFRKN